VHYSSWLLNINRVRHDHIIITATFNRCNSLHFSISSVRFTLWSKRLATVIEPTKTFSLRKTNMCKLILLLHYEHVLTLFITAIILILLSLLNSYHDIFSINIFYPSSRNCIPNPATKLPLMLQIFQKSKNRAENEQLLVWHISGPLPQQCSCPSVTHAASHSPPGNTSAHISFTQSPSHLYC